MNTEVYFEEVQVGDAIPPLTKEPITPIQLAKYAGASGDFNPIHYSEPAAQAAGLGGIIAHGMLMMGIAAQAITNWIPQHRLRRFKVRFVGVTRPGDEVTVSGKVTNKQEVDGEAVIFCDIQIVNQKGETKLSGSFNAILPHKA